jgi:tripartite-type tricarboxylate transporter receptor subunit TctC
MNTIGRRRFLAAALGASGAMVWGRASAQGYPARPVRYLVGFAPGGTSDLVARTINPLLAAKLGQPVVIENMPSAGGVLATGTVAKAAADGYTVMHTSNSFLTVTPHLISVPFDPMVDLEPAAYLGSSVQILCVSPTLPVNTVAEFIAYAKANPGKLNYGSSGTATGNHITCEYMKRAAGIDVVHVPYKGAGPAITDLIAGRIQFMTDPALIPQVQAGKVRAIGVVDAPKHPTMPDLQYLGAVIPNWNPPQWYNFVSVPAKTPREVKERLNKAVNETMVDAAVREKLGQNSIVFEPRTPESLAAKLKQEYVTMGELLKAADIKLS